MVTLFLILTVGWFIYAFIRLIQELVLDLRKVSAGANCTEEINVDPEVSPLSGQMVKDSYGPTP